ncbi:HER047Cp [Eremothecium sinecaudum]|uniref:HER047Cp n=1 Tax=Eremothecium sinecaudum TaxID=45286 RepID=A0A0X8HT25_9SACH|nr:HER047Cp [Eremothecium sinecaudum]AMD21326.1 HER047Cp [Eremothecium sinecaudum]
MDLFKVADYYLNRILNPQLRTSVNVVEQSRIKVLLLDKNTTPIISMIATQTELLNKGIYMVDTVENIERDCMRNLNCICYFKPTDDTIENLVKELEDPKYGSYQLFFSNIISKAQLERLAEADSLEVVTKVEEIFLDFYILSETLFSFDIQLPEVVNSSLNWIPRGLDEVKRRLVSVLLSLKVRPNIYFESNSNMSGILAKEVQNEIERNDKTLFDFPRMDATPILLILDRNNDVLTPILQPWSYQSMIHEYIGMKGNIVDLSEVPDIADDLKQAVLSSKQDQFYHETMYLNFGDLGDRVKQYVAQYKSKTNSSSKIETIEDIKRFIEKFPEFKKLSSNVSKHMSILGELDRQLSMKQIWQLSELEQNLSVHEDDSDDYQEMLKLLKSPDLISYYKLKLACIYYLKHYAQTQKLQAVEKLLREECSPQEVAVFYKFKTTYSGSPLQGRKSQDKDIISGLTKKFNKIGHSGPDNVFMQHSPRLDSLLNDIARNTLPNGLFTGVTRQRPPTAPFQDIIIFMVGGITMEEARIVHQFNTSMKNKNGAVRIVIGGNNVLKTKDFLEDFKRLHCTSDKSTQLGDLL